MISTTLFSPTEPDTERSVDAYSFILLEQSANVNTYFLFFCQN